MPDKELIAEIAESEDYVSTLGLRDGKETILTVLGEDIPIEVGYVLEHEGEMVQVLARCFVVSRGFARSRVKSHLPANWRVVNRPLIAAPPEDEDDSPGNGDAPA